MFNRIRSAIQAGSEIIRGRAVTLKASDNSPYGKIVGPVGTPDWWDTNYVTYATEGFNQNSLIYGSIMYRIRAFSQATRRAYLGELNKPEWLAPPDPLAILLRQPNASLSGMQIQSLEMLYLSLSGNSYTFIERGAGNAAVGLWPLRPDRVRLIPVKNKPLLGYAYVPDVLLPNNVIPILPEDMIHVKLPNPLDEFEGMGKGLSPVSAASQSGDVDNKLTKFLALFSDSGLMPMGMLTSKSKLSDQDVKRMKQRWRDRYGGYKNWGDVMIIDADATFQRLGMTLNEMQFNNIDERNETRILQALGVDPILLATTIGLKRATYENKREARRAFWEDIMSFELQLFADQYSEKLDPEDFNRNIGHDTSRVPALQKNVMDGATAAKGLWAMGMPAVQALDVVGITVDEFEGGDLPFAGIRGGSGNATPDNDEDSETDESEDVDEGNEDEEETLSLPQPYDPETLQDIRRLFTDDAKAIIAILFNLEVEARKESRSFRWSDASPDISLYYEMLASIWWREVLPKRSRIVVQECTDLLVGMMTSGDQRNLSMSDMMSDIEHLFSRWRYVSAPELAAKEDNDPVFEDDDVVITEDDIQAAIDEAATADPELADILDAEVV